MFSLATIRSMNEKACQRAMREKQVPYVASGDEEVDKWEKGTQFPFPELSDYCPEGWEEVEDTQWFVDMTGFGQDDEPALSIKQFLDELRLYIILNPKHGFAITEHGQFQCYVSAFRKI